MPYAYFKTDTSEPVRCSFTADGRIDFSVLGRRFGFDPISIALNGIEFPKKGLESVLKWEQIEKDFTTDSYPLGTKDAPVLVTGEALVRAVSTEESPAKKSKSLPGGPSSQDGSHCKEEQVFWDNLSKAELEKVNLDVKVSDAEEATPHEVTILKLQENSTFMGSLSERSKIMVPKFYEDLWKIAEDLMGKAVRMRMLITGTPGTGKSVMGWYFIYMLRNKLGSFDLVYQHECSKLQYFYSKDGPVTVGSTSLDLFRSKLSSADTVYVVDGAGALELTAKTFIFSPDAKGNWKIKKIPSMKWYYSKVWSKIDILAARQLLYEDVDESSVRQLYMKWGGVPRHVLEKANDRTWQQKLLDKTAMVPGRKWIDCVTNDGGSKGTTDVALHYRTENYQNFTVDFATTHVSEIAFAALKNSAWASTVQFLRREDSCSAGLRGQLFELAVHEFLKRKGSVRVRSLEGNGQSEIEMIPWPELPSREFRNVQEVKAGRVGCYWCPVSKTNPAFDAVCTSIGAALGTSAALQITISKIHSIKHDGLEKLLQAESSVKRLYFVVPSLIFEDFKKQAIVNTNGKPRVQKMSDLVSGVEQWALEV